MGEPFQDTSRPESTCDPSDISHMDTHMPATQSHTVCVSVTSSLADSDLQAALAESQSGITELKYIVLKRLIQDWASVTFLKVEVVQLTSDSYMTNFNKRHSTY